jgi:polysaccharide export outer membrane protein
VKVLTLLIIAPMLYAQPAPQFADRNARYRLQPTDVIEVHYRYTPEFNQIITIQPDGYVATQIAGDLKLQGLTLEEAKSLLLERSKARLKDPEVTLTLKEFEKPYFEVGGEVANPGRFDLRGDTSAIEAIARAGGFKTNSAKHSQVILFRRVGPTLAKAEILNLKAVTQPPFTESDTALRSGDVLIVPQNRVSKIERFVKWVNIGAYWNPILK